ncbi:MAG: YibE/F family protein [Actinomycetaceae bacterium]|nr:YibE/F family protein [Actinomycetaceae bacterium]
MRRNTSKSLIVALTAIVVPLIVATLVGLVLLWPAKSPVRSLPAMAPGVKMVTAKVTSTHEHFCHLSDPEFRQQESVCAKVTSGANKGDEVAVAVPPEVHRALHVGTTIKASYDSRATGNFYGYWDANRSLPMALLIGLYLVLVVGIARWRGMAALLGLVFSSAVLLFFVMPALMAGKPALPVTLVGISAMLVASVYCAHGISVRTTTALLGTYGGIVVTAALSYTLIPAATLSGASSDDSLLIFGLLPKANLQAFLICGVILAGLGVLNDVTITQASATWELYLTDPQQSRSQLFARSMRIGRDHIASTVYTLAFAYAGTAMPTLILALMVQRGGWDLATSASIAEEIIRTLIASVGLLLAIPLTTLVATLLVRVGEHAGKVVPAVSASYAPTAIEPEDAAATSVTTANTGKTVNTLGAVDTPDLTGHNRFGN